MLNHRIIISDLASNLQTENKVNHSEVTQIATDLQLMKKFAKENKNFPYISDCKTVDIHTFAYLKATYKNAKYTLHQYSKNKIYFELEIGKKNYRMYVKSQPITIQLC